MVALARPRQVQPISLAQLATVLDAPLSTRFGRVEVTGVTLSSSQVRPGDLFTALPGAHTHGIRFAADALAAGAVAILTDPVGAQSDLEDGNPVLVVPDPRAVLGRVASTVYRDPSSHLSVLGVTGTNGKTTTCYLIEAALRAAEVSAGLIGTIETRMNTRDGLVAVPALRTTPEAPDLQATLAVMVENGVSAVAMEVSSHALALDRVAGTAFEVAAFTNFSQDHLDFHNDLESYFQAKALLFDGRARHEVVMVDDDWGRRLVRPNTITVSAAGKAAAHWHSQRVSASGGRTSFLARGPGGRAVPVRLGVPGNFNVANALLALAILDCIGIDIDIAAQGLTTARVPGRMEVVDRGQPFTAVVDYAHTPVAVATLLRALRGQTEGPVVIVLGCGGDRDAAKRPMMGEVAARGSDLLIITDDNPRTEDPAAIRDAMRFGALNVDPSRRGEVLEMGGRAEAIAAGVARLDGTGALVIAGKGHEQGQEIDGVITAFDDRSVLEAALAVHGWLGGRGS